MGLRRGAGAAALALAAVVLVWLLLSGGGDESSDDDPEPAGATTTSEGSDPAEASAEAEALAEGLMLVGFEGDDPKRALDELGGRAYGGVLVGSANWPGEQPGTELVAKLREELGAGDGPAPLLATRQEGGAYRSLPDLPPELREVEIGDKGKQKLTSAWAEDTAKALEGAGFDLNLAPVADIATLSSPIADRAFSDLPGVAAEMTAVTIEACEKERLACAVSHFPGLGGASQDTDLGPASVGVDAGTIAARDLLPFRAAFAADAPAVVVGHGLYAAYDPVTPASLSPAITTDLLRGDLGFDGLVVSDDIGAGAIDAVMDPGDAAVEAISAGVDLVQVSNPADVAGVRRALAAAIEAGELPAARLEDAGQRIARLAG